MKKIILLCCFMMLPLFANAETTGSKTIDRIQINGEGSGNVAAYFFYKAGGWGAPACPSHTFAKIRSDELASKEILTLATEAKKAGTSVRFRGDCAAVGPYFEINYMYFY
jgi:hypothetical protein